MTRTRMKTRMRTERILRAAVMRKRKRMKGMRTVRWMTPQNTWNSRLLSG